MERKISRRAFVGGFGLLAGKIFTKSLLEDFSVLEPGGGVFGSLPKTPTPVSVPDLDIYQEKKELRITLKQLKTPIAETFPNLANKFLWRGDSRKAKVAITIDDGWWEEAIVKTTEVLKSTKTSLTLFVPGQAILAFPGRWRELVNLGCKIECHSYTHRFDVAKLSVEEIVDEIDRSQEALNNVLGKPAPFTFYRPVGGTISENIYKALETRNLKGVIWTMSGFGTSSVATPETVSQRILSLANNGYITLHHFIKNDALALEPIISGLKAKGLTPSRLEEVL